MRACFREKNQTGGKRNLWLRWGLDSVLLLAVSAAAGTLLLLLAARIPQGAIYENAVRSAELLQEEGTYPSVWPGVVGTQLDNFTDGWMLNIAFTSTDDPVYDALQATYTKKAGLGPLDSLCAYLNGEEDSCSVKTYGRYWHGYLVFLKPLLCIMDLSSIRSLNLLFQAVLLLALFFLLVRRGKPQLCVPYFILWISLSPAALASSLQYCAVFYSTLLLSLLLAWGQGAMDDRRRCLLFELGGLLVAYFDLLTYPAVALGVPLILFLSLDYGQRRPVKRRVQEVFLYSVSWGIGYGGMWALKWAVASAFTGDHVLASALNAAKFRTSHQYNELTFTWQATILANLEPLKTVILGAALLLALLCLLALSVKCGTMQRDLPAMLAIAAVCCYPLAWYYVFMNHSCVHSFMTYREMAVAVYGMVSLGFVQIDPGRPAEGR